MHRRFAPASYSFSARLIASSIGFGSSLGLVSQAAAQVTIPPPTAPASNTRFGLGISLVDVFGASAKFFITPAHALQAELGWAAMHHGHGRMGFSYLWHIATAYEEEDIVSLIPYVGAGLGVAFWSPHDTNRHFAEGQAGLLMQLPIVGLTAHWAQLPIDTAIEGSWSPYLAPTDLRHGDISVKARWYF